MRAFFLKILEFGSAMVNRAKSSFSTAGDTVSQTDTLRNSVAVTKDTYGAVISRSIAGPVERRLLQKSNFSEISKMLNFYLGNLANFEEALSRVLKQQLDPYRIFTPAYHDFYDACITYVRDYSVVNLSSPFRDERSSLIRTNHNRAVTAARAVQKDLGRAIAGLDLFYEVMLEQLVSTKFGDKLHCLYDYEKKQPRGRIIKLIDYVIKDRSAATVRYKTLDTPVEKLTNAEHRTVIDYYHVQLANYMVGIHAEIIGYFSIRDPRSCEIAANCNRFVAARLNRLLKLYGQYAVSIDRLRVLVPFVRRIAGMEIIGNDEDTIDKKKRWYLINNAEEINSCSRLLSDIKHCEDIWMLVIDPYTAPPAASIDIEKDDAGKNSLYLSKIMTERNISRKMTDIDDVAIFDPVWRSPNARDTPYRGQRMLSVEQRVEAL
ncbi:hypothetical protein PAPHI01_2426 [Pancytospora philotis]|nr:hypothetical protein PAPHI01_1971 [Pancytospora philotis]KAI4293152.1 hypothetical protein PAPHI01_2426 [Pancytospora philotis]